jgi:hypothetical protein
MGYEIIISLAKKTGLSLSKVRNWKIETVTGNNINA